MHVMGMRLMGVYLMGVHLMGMCLMSVYLRHASHREVSHERVPHGHASHRHTSHRHTSHRRVSHRRVPHGHVFHKRVSYRLHMLDFKLPAVVPTIRPKMSIVTFALRTPPCARNWALSPGALLLRNSSANLIPGHEHGSYFPRAVAHSGQRLLGPIRDHCSYHLLSARCSAFGHIDIEAI
jgi:hypothetical protein